MSCFCRFSAPGFYNSENFCANLKNMARDFQAGDDLVFQLESGYGLLRVLGVEETERDGTIWHLAAYEDLFPDTEAAEAALRENPDRMRFSIPHVAMTNRAFERTPTAKLSNRPLSESERLAVENWRSRPDREPVDRSALQMLGLR
jgi:hypothetical protein